jgi:hypothetical protein
MPIIKELLFDENCLNNMRLTFLFIAVFLFANYTVAQQFSIKLNSNETIHADKLVIAEDLFRPIPVVMINGKKVRLNSIQYIYDSTLMLTYKTIRFRKRIALARQLEYGSICLYDFHEPDHRSSLNNKRISSNNRFYYHHQGDSVLKVLNRKNFEKLFDTAFAASYPNFESIKKKYLQLQPLGITSAILWPNLITVSGFQSAAILVPYLAATTFVTGKALINRQKKFNKVRILVRDFNRLKP